MTLCECNAIDVMNKTLADSSEILLAPLCKRVCVLLETREREKKTHANGHRQHIQTQTHSYSYLSKNVGPETHLGCLHRLHTRLINY